jgi:hypothetical protein
MALVLRSLDGQAALFVLAPCQRYFPTRGEPDVAAFRGVAQELLQPADAGGSRIPSAVVPPGNCVSHARLATARGVELLEPVASRWNSQRPAACGRRG